MLLRQIQCHRNEWKLENKTHFVKSENHVSSSRQTMMSCNCHRTEIQTGVKVNKVEQKGKFLTLTIGQPSSRLTLKGIWPSDHRHNHCHVRCQLINDVTPEYHNWIFLRNQAMVSLYFLLAASWRRPFWNHLTCVIAAKFSSAGEFFVLIMVSPSPTHKLQPNC